MEVPTKIKCLRRRIEIDFPEIHFLIEQQKSAFGPEIFVNIFGYFVGAGIPSKKSLRNYHFTFRGDEVESLEGCMKYLNSPNGFHIKSDSDHAKSIADALSCHATVQLYCKPKELYLPRENGAVVVGGYYEFLSDQCFGKK
ncbi:MAG: hypothetical protein AAGJ94_00295 [Pseudomonadota bacterium]